MAGEVQKKKKSARHPSAMKRARQSEKKHLRNKTAISSMRTAIKKFRILISEKKVPEGKKELPAVYDLIDRMRKRGIIHSNTASRYKSRLTKALNAISASK